MSNDIATQTLINRFAGGYKPSPYTEAQAVEILEEMNISREQYMKVTGFGHRYGRDCKADDTILNKFRAGALSARGVCAAIFGTDSPQHHKGHNRIDQ